MITHGFPGPRRRIGVSQYQNRETEPGAYNSDPGAISVAAAVLLAGVTDVPRVESIEADGVDAEASMEEATAAHDENMDALVDDGLDTLF